MQPASNNDDRARGLESGDLINGLFKIQNYVAEGGMGFIYRGIKLPEETPVAIKVMRDGLSSDPTCVKRFQREAKAVNRLEHPNTISLYDFGFDESLSLMYIAMEWLEGEDLSQHLLKHGALASRNAALYAYQTAISLSEAHAKNIIHRDLKPENIFLLKNGAEGEDIRVLDFGIAKMVNEPAQTQITRIGMVCGTPEYMSPEQARGEELDGRSDIYALGCVLYALLTGAPPFDSDNPLHVIMKHQLEPLPACPDTVPKALRDIVTQCTHKDRELRFANTDELALTLQSFIEGWADEDEGDMLADLGEGETLMAMPSLNSSGDALSTKVTDEGDAPRATETAASKHAQASNLATVTELPQHAPVSSGKGPLLVLVAVVFVIGSVIVILVMQNNADPPKEAAPATPPATETANTLQPTVAEAFVIIEVQPPVKGARVLGPNGAVLGPPPQKILNTEGVQGRYEIMAPGHKRNHVDIDAKPGVNSEHVVPLVPIEQVERFTCTITVEPADATVAFRGKPLTSPYDIELESGEKGTLQIKKSGFQDVAYPLVGHAKCSQTFTLEESGKKKRGGKTEQQDPVKSIKTFDE